MDINNKIDDTKQFIRSRKSETVGKTMATKKDKTINGRQKTTRNLIIEPH